MVSRAALACGALAAALGAWGLFGWFTGSHLLARIDPRFIPLSPDTALALIVLGSILAIVEHIRRPALRAICAGVVIVVSIYGLLKSAEYLAGLDLTFASLLFPVSEQLGAYPLGRMSPATGVLFLLTGAALVSTLGFAARPRWTSLASGLGLFVAVAGFVAVTGYVVGTPVLYDGDIIPLDPISPVAFLLLGLGIIAAQGSGSMFVRPLVGPALSARMLRAFLPLTAAIVLSEAFLNELLTHELRLNVAIVFPALVLVFLTLAAAAISRISGALATSIEKTEAERHRLQIETSWLASFPRLNPNPVLEVDLAGSIYYLNPAAEKALPDLRQLGLAHPWLEDWQTLASEIRGGAMRLREARAGEKWYLLAHSFVPESQRVRIYSVDITERKHAEQAVQATRAKLDAALESMTDAVCISDTVGNFFDFNEAFATFHRFKNKQECAKTLAEYPNFLDVFAANGELAPLDQWAVPRALRGEIGTNVEYSLRRKDTGDRWVGSYSFSPVRDARGAIVGSVVVGRDITDAKRTEEALRKSEERYRALFENMVDGYAYCQMLFDEQERPVDFVYLDVNPAFTAKTGLENVVGRRVSEVIPGIQASNPELFEIYGRVALTGRPEKFETYLSSLNIWFSISVFRPAREYFVAVFETITERKQAEQTLARRTAELERSNRELEQFAYVASHDLQEPLRMVASYTQLLNKRYKDKLDSDANEFMAYAVDGATRMQALINDLLAYSRVNTKGKAFETVDSATCLGQAIVNLRMSIVESRAIVTNDDLPTVRGDPTQLAQLFQNLIGNAIKFRGVALPHVHIAAVDRGPEWEFAVRDNGIGFEPQFAERIFVIFQRLHTRQEYPGTGIGLSICQRIVERHGGRIWAHSEPGKGATFYFTIPKSPSQGEK